MLPRIALLILLASAVAVDAGGPASKLVGKWLWQGVDAHAVLSFEADRTYVLERIGFENHDILKGTWKVDGSRLIISLPGIPEDVRTIVKLTSNTLILRSPAEGKETYSRIK
jgi:hypothetical protein